jgi:TonB family protein
MARLALALYWWNPLVVHAWRAFLKEREHATDDLVLSVGEPAADYANHLLEIARGMQAAPVAAVAMARKSELEDRLMAILNSNLARAGSSRTTVAVALLLAAVATAPLASLRAQQDAPLPDVEALMRLAEASNNPEPLRAAIRTAERERRIDIAMALAEAALPLQARISGEGSVEFGQLLLKLGDLQRRRAKWENALTTYQKAVAILGERPETAHAITYFGIRALIKEDFTAAQEHLQKAQALNPENGAATMWMAMLRLKQNDPVEAESLFQSALARQPSESIEAATTMELYAHMLTANNRESEGKLLRERAEAIRKAAGAAPAPSPAGSVLKSGGNVTPPALAHKVEPVYTDEARAAKLQGTVIVYAEIGPNGQPHRLGILRGLGLGLDEQALDAIAQWRFKPGTKDGQPVNVAATIEVNFRLL